MSSWPDDDEEVPPDCRSQDVIFWVALAFVAAIIAAMFFTGAK